MIRLEALPAAFNVFRNDLCQRPHNAGEVFPVLEPLYVIFQSHPSLYLHDTRRILRILTQHNGTTTGALFYLLESVTPMWVELVKSHAVFQCKDDVFNALGSSGECLTEGIEQVVVSRIQGLGGGCLDRSSVLRSRRLECCVCLKASAILLEGRTLTLFHSTHRTLTSGSSLAIPSKITPLHPGAPFSSSKACTCLFLVTGSDRFGLKETSDTTLVEDILYVAEVTLRTLMKCDSDKRDPLARHCNAVARSSGSASEPTSGILIHLTVVDGWCLARPPAEV